MCFVPLLVLAERNKALDDKLAEIEQRVREQSQVLKSQQEERSQLRSELQSISSQMERLAAQEQAQEDELRQIDLDMSELKVEIERLDKKISKRRVLSQKRLRALYMYRPESVFDALIGSQENERLLSAGYYLSKIRSVDTALLDSFRSLQSDHRKKQKELVKRSKQKQVALTKLSDTRKLQLNEQRQKRKVLEELEQREAYTKKTLVTLQTEAERLEGVIARLTGGVPAPPKESDKPEQEVDIRKEQKEDPLPFDGPGLSSAKKGVLIPVAGKLLRDYGKRKHERFSDIIFQKGIEIEVERNAPISIIEDGKILYVGDMPALGKIAIVDHGKRYYSLYSKLQELRFEPGDRVKKGDILAIVKPDKEEEGRHLFYFEIRKDGKPVDPQKYYRRKFRVGSVFK